MTYLGKAAAEEVVAACQAGAVELGAALAPLLGATVEVAVGEPGRLDAESMADGEWDGPGLIVLLNREGSAALLTLPESCGLLPDWYGEPDATGQSVLGAMAQELGMLVLPEAYAPEGFKAARVANLAAAIARGGVADGAGTVPLRLTAPSGEQATLNMIWPADSPTDVFAAPPAAKSAAPPPKAPAPADDDFDGAGMPYSVDELPTYSRSLLRIKVPVIVTLAESKQPIGRIIELGPGTIIQFDKSCEEMLSMQVGEQLVAEGEAVKVGDKFGIRLTALRMPGERFNPVRKG
ncbi:MAG TPA: FliM/FliN family flagellar motor C-terminal domain-containing protein [Pirellulales bacterium]|jgi:flagellar motor switch/type III secretory pathway protein FliN|nr:FliM/FliN family flagellar motor C-terminal domain-containing protein [Pirellulales bacterium]